MYLQDVGGDENFHLFLQPLDGRPAKDLTAFDGVRAQNLVTDKHFPGEVGFQSMAIFCHVQTPDVGMFLLLMHATSIATL